ncbi:hypothetical protein FOA52_011118 [Chlamydomonas sp. UWO 241]|nr:hypothetical protein FOA52_011118 [Chlamydomonas sp. UWO 241]
MAKRLMAALALAALALASSLGSTHAYVQDLTSTSPSPPSPGIYPPPGHPGDAVARHLYRNVVLGGTDTWMNGSFHQVLDSKQAFSLTMDLDFDMYNDTNAGDPTHHFVPYGGGGLGGFSTTRGSPWQMPFGPLLALYPKTETDPTCWHVPRSGLPWRLLHATRVILANAFGVSSDGEGSPNAPIAIRGGVRPAVAPAHFKNSGVMIKFDADVTPRFATPGGVIADPTNPLLWWELACVAGSYNTCLSVSLLKSSWKSFKTEYGLCVEGDHRQNCLVGGRIAPPPHAPPQPSPPQPSPPQPSPPQPSPPQPAPPTPLPPAPLLPAPLPLAPLPSAPPPAETLAQMERVASWQLVNPARYPRDSWVQAAGYTGMLALAEVSASPRFHDAMMAMGAGNRWRPAARVYNADDHCVGQAYLALYALHLDPAMIAPITARFDFILAHPMDDKLEFVGARRGDRWAWCDSLFMAPPVWTLLAALTGKSVYLDFMVNHWWKTSDYLYDADEHLYFRDSSYFGRTEANGEKVFWSRGNGWVLGGLVRVLENLPASHPARPRFEQQFREMAARVVALQQPDGLWRSSLLDPASFPAQEASGSGFFCYGLLWGVNHGLLDRATYLPSALSAWGALTACVQPDGKLIHVQPIGADPKNFPANSTEPYGVGAFLLAGREVYRLDQ